MQAQMAGFVFDQAKKNLTSEQMMQLGSFVLT